MSKQIVKKNKGMSNTITQVYEKFLPTVEQMLSGYGVQYDEYQKVCTMNALSAITDLLNDHKSSWKDQQLDTSNFTQVLAEVATFKLNALAQPREVYFTLRSKKLENGSWTKRISLGIEGDGNDAILRNFGVDIEKVGQYWAVREGDKFTPAEYNGFDVTPPKWTPTGKGKVIRIVYPIMKKSGECEFYFGERADVKVNLIAHINSNMMNETFGICADRYKATAAQRNEINDKKDELKQKLSNMELEEILDSEEFKKWISPAWKDPHSRESMIERKMRNNAIKKIPKDFGSMYAEKAYMKLTDDRVAATAEEIVTNANTGEVIDFEEVDEVKEIAEEVDTVKDTTETESEPDFTEEEKKEIIEKEFKMAEFEDLNFNEPY